MHSLGGSPQDGEISKDAYHRRVGICNLEISNLIMQLISYTKTNRSKFDDESRHVLDAICEVYPRLEIEGPAQTQGPTKWFVQVYRDRAEEVPEGFYGATVAEAATRIASAVGVSIPDAAETTTSNDDEAS